MSKISTYFLSLVIGLGITAPSFSASKINKFYDISASDDHAIAIGENGSLYGWGDNAGEFGTGEMGSNYYTYPTQLLPDDQESTVWVLGRANYSSSLALNQDGEIYTWGQNVNCQLGQGLESGTTVYLPAAINAQNQTPFTEIVTTTSAYYSSTTGTVIAMTENGKLWGWGFNGNGQLADGTTEDACLPQAIAEEQSFSSISHSATHAVAVSTDGDLWAWGDNYYKQLGDGSTVDVLEPKQIITGKKWLKAIAGINYTLVIDEDGILYGVGYGDRNQLGENSRLDSLVVIDTDSWVDVSVGYYHVIGKKSDGSIWSWGYGGDGQLGLGQNSSGNNITTTEGIPTQIGTATDWQTITASTFASFAIKDDNTLWAWGDAGDYLQGTGSSADEWTPQSISYRMIHKATAVSAGYVHFLHLDASGLLWGSQNRNSGRLGDGNVSGSTRGTPVLATTNHWQMASGGSDFTLAIKDDNTLWGWGDNNDNMFDSTDVTRAYRPIQVSDDKWSFVSAGGAHLAAITQTGELWLSGDNYYGQIGDGSRNDPQTLVRLGSDSDWYSVSLLRASTIALKQDGTLWSWGYNNLGQLGRGFTSSYEETPAPLYAGGDWSYLAQGSSASHTLAIKQDGSLWSWGYNRYGQLGLDHTDNVSVPTQIGTKTNWAMAVVSRYDSLALKTDGSLYGWGRNQYGQLGKGDKDQVNKPVFISGGWKSIALTEHSAIGIKENGDVYIWGYVNTPNGTKTSLVPTQYSYLDRDFDGVADAADAFPYDETEIQDYDFDGIGDVADSDDDNDGYDDIYELANGSSPWHANTGYEDSDSDGYLLSFEYTAGSYDNSASSIPTRDIYTQYTFASTSELNEFNNAGWQRDSNSDSRSGFALNSTTKVDNGEDIFTKSASFNEGMFSFAVKTSTEEFDKFYFQIDGTLQETTLIGGDTQWQVFVFDIDAGEHTLSWHYKKDDESAELEDTVWVTDIVLPLNLDVLDSDQDGMPDGWEYRFGFNPFSNSDVNGDPDNDGLTNYQEYIANTNPLIADTDGDGLPDGYEVDNGFDPTSATDAKMDGDNDGLTNLEEFTYGTNPFDSDSDGDGVSDYDEVASGSDPLDQNIIVGVPNLLVAVNDANGDSVNDWVKYTLTDNSVDINLLSGVDNAEIANFSIVHSYDDVSVSILADRNNDNVEEIGVFGFDAAANRYQLVVHDATSGSKFGAWNWPATLGEVSFEALTDLTQDGIQEYAISGVHLGNGTRQLVVKDGSTKAAYQTFKWPNLWDRLSFVTMTDVTFDNVPEVALYGRHTRLDKGQLFIYDGADANSKVDVYNWNKLWNDIQLVEMDDIDGDGTIDWGQFGQRKDDGRYQWLVKKGHDKRGVIRTFSWPNDLVDVQPMLVGDRTQDGIREVAVVGTNPNTGKVFLRINDGALANERIANISWPASWEDIQVKELGDLNNDGFNEYGLLGYTKTNRTVQLIVKDGKALTEYGRYTLTGRWEGLSLSNGDINQDGVMDIVIEGINQSTELRTVTALEGTSLELLSSQVIN
ncbi:hypothetical protein [Shewanella sp. 6_MG-2023]|uniref:RCC1 domain-containing protein n=1 Tax=Shewanella sp. 6_MG-2023 TaxID=3062660 RepID=UPI0026E3FDC5|nr:hypothetical protein [Shewanella sp. 6_MG-2023]MDO6617639.1 hypothetical protein [Shewanella sp. 6_MG-2023]